MTGKLGVQAIRRTAFFFLLFQLLAMSSCDAAEKTALPNRWHWRPDAHHMCSTVGGIDYCFPNNDLDAWSLDSDDGAGFLLTVPVESNPTIMKCNEKSIKLQEANFRNNGKYINLNFGDKPSRDTFEEFYSRIINMRIGNENKYIVDLDKSYVMYGMKCLNILKGAPLNGEFVCHGGNIEGNNIAAIWSCDRLAPIGGDGYPNPGCTDELFKNKAYYKISYNKQCLSHVLMIRQFVLDYVEAARLKGEK